MKHSEQERIIALAGVVQAADQVAALAKKTSVQATAINTSLRSILITDPENTVDVFGDTDSIRVGLRALKYRLENPSTPEHTDATRYAVTLLHLARRVMKRPAVQNELAQGMRSIKAALGNPANEELDEDAIGRLAALYQRTISEMGPRVIVNGEPDVLANPVKAATIRALLLAGIRAAVLWYQCGGNRLQLLTARKTILSAVNSLLSER